MLHTVIPSFRYNANTDDQVDERYLDHAKSGELGGQTSLTVRRQDK